MTVSPTTRLDTQVTNKGKALAWFAPASARLRPTPGVELVGGGGGGGDGAVKVLGHLPALTGTATASWVVAASSATAAGASLGTVEVSGTCGGDFSAAVVVP